MKIVGVSIIPRKLQGLDLRYPIVGTNLLADKLRRKLGEQERAIKYRHAIVVIIGSQAKIV